MTSAFLSLRPGRCCASTLFCMPFAGGGAAAYRTWPDLLPKSVEPVAVMLPGRESRFAEEPFDRMAPLLEHLLDDLPAWLDRPYACFGYSMGARVGLALTQAVSARGLPGPSALFVAASPGPSLPVEVPGWNGSDEELTEHLHRLGGIPDELRAEPEVLELMLPTVRADLAVVATWPHGGVPVARPIHAFAGIDDWYATPDRMQAWERETTDRFQLTVVPGGHFFLGADGGPVLDAVVAELAPAGGGG